MKITNWPSTHINLVSGWACFVITIILGWFAAMLDLKINEGMYTTLLITTGAWAGVAAPAALIGKRATTKPEMSVTVTETGSPAKTTTTTVMPPATTESEK